MAGVTKNFKQKDTFSQAKNASDIVKKDGVIKEQVDLELQSTQSWQEKWGYMLDFHKVCLEEAEKMGLSNEEYKRIVTKHKESNLPALVSWEVCSSEPHPATSSGMIGLRGARLSCNLERLGPLYISPRHTMECPDFTPDPPQKNIWLG